MYAILDLFTISTPSLVVDIVTDQTILFNNIVDAEIYAINNLQKGHYTIVSIPIIP